MIHRTSRHLTLSHFDTLHSVGELHLKGCVRDLATAQDWPSLNTCLDYLETHGERVRQFQGAIDEVGPDERRATMDTQSSLFVVPAASYTHIFARALAASAGDDANASASTVSSDALRFAERLQRLYSRPDRKPQRDALLHDAARFVGDARVHHILLMGANANALLPTYNEPFERCTPAFIEALAHLQDNPASPSLAAAAVLIGGSHPDTVANGLTGLFANLGKANASFSKGAFNDPQWAAIASGMAKDPTSAGAWMDAVCAALESKQRTVAAPRSGVFRMACAVAYLQRQTALDRPWHGDAVKAIVDDGVAISRTLDAFAREHRDVSWESFQGFNSTIRLKSYERIELEFFQAVLVNQCTDLLALCADVAHASALAGGPGIESAIAVADHAKRCGLPQANASRAIDPARFATTIAFLVEQGHDVNAALHGYDDGSNRRWSALHVCAERSGDVIGAMLPALLKAGANIRQEMDGLGLPESLVASAFLDRWRSIDRAFQAHKRSSELLEQFDRLQHVGAPLTTPP